MVHFTLATIAEKVSRAIRCALANSQCPVPRLRGRATLGRDLLVLKHNLLQNSLYCLFGFRRLHSIGVLQVRLENAYFLRRLRLLILDIMLTCSQQAGFIVIDFIGAKEIVDTTVTIMARDVALLVFFGPDPILKESIVVFVFYLGNLVTCSWVFMAVVVRAKAGRPATCCRIRPIKTHLSFFRAHTRTAISMVCAIQLRKLNFKCLAVLVKFFPIPLGSLNIEWVSLLLIVWSSIAIQLAIEGLKLSMNCAGFPSSKGSCWDGSVPTRLLQHLRFIKLIWTFTNVYFSIKYRSIGLDSTFQRLLLTQLGHARGNRGLRINYITRSQPGLLLTINHMRLSPPTCNWLSVIFIPTLLDLMGLLRHLSRYHICLLIMAKKRIFLPAKIAIVSRSKFRLVSATADELLVSATECRFNFLGAETAATVYDVIT